MDDGSSSFGLLQNLILGQRWDIKVVYMRNKRNTGREKRKQDKEDSHCILCYQISYYCGGLEDNSIGQILGRSVEHSPYYNPI